MTQASAGVRATLTALAAATVVVSAGPAAAQAGRPAISNEFDRPYGMGYGQEILPYEARTRDVNGNRVILDGRIVVGDDLSTLPAGLYNMNGLMSGGTGLNGIGSGQAIGNQLNVITQGSWNTVVVTSTQTNNGDINVNVGAPTGPTVATCPGGGTDCPTATPDPAPQQFQMVGVDQIDPALSGVTTSLDRLGNGQLFLNGELNFND